MESVIDKIRQARENENKKKADSFATETVIDGCQVKMRFDAIGDVKALSAIKSMLISAYMDAVSTSLTGGECA